MRLKGWHPALIGFVACWLMYGVYRLLGGSYTLLTALVFGASSVALGLRQFSLQRQKRHDK